MFIVQLQAFYLGVTNEWLEAMSVVIGEKQVCTHDMFVNG